MLLFSSPVFTKINTTIGYIKKLSRTISSMVDGLAKLALALATLALSPLVPHYRFIL